MNPPVAAAVQWADLRVEVHPITGEAHRDPKGYRIPDADTAALELALTLAERWGSEVVVVTAGPEAADGALREAIAVGAGRAVRIDVGEDAPQTLIADAIAEVVVAAGATVVCCGAAGPDRASGSVPAFLAHRLLAAQALGLVSVEPGPPGEVTALRRLDGGRRERLRVTAPAVLSVEGSVARLRRASLAGELAARHAAVDVRPAAATGHRAAAARMMPYRPRARVVPPPEGSTPAARIGTLVAPVAAVARAEPELLEPAEAADRLLAALREWGELT